MFYRRLQLIVPLAVLTLSACSVHAPTRQSPDAADSRTAVMDKLQKTEPCCTRFADFDFNRELPAKPRRYEIKPGLPAADFNGTRSYFLAFRLPGKHKLPYRIVLKSEMTGRWLHNSYLFAPSVVILDGRFRPMQTIDIQQCEYIGWSNATSGALGSVTVDTRRARYLVVYTSGQQLAGSTYWEQSPTAFSADAPVKMAASGSFQISHGPNGPLYVGVMTPRYARAAAEAICGKPRTQTSGGALSTLRSLILPGAHEDAE
jgi:maltose operon periplasmic protein